MQNVKDSYKKHFKLFPDFYVCSNDYPYTLYLKKYSAKTLSSVFYLNNFLYVIFLSGKSKMPKLNRLLIFIFIEHFVLFNKICARIVLISKFVLYANMDDFLAPMNAKAYFFFKKYHGMLIKLF